MTALIRSRDVKNADEVSRWSDISLGGIDILRAFDANTFFSRLRGLHALLPLAPSEALIIRPCNAIHTLTMPCTIDVVFVDKQGCVLRCESVSKRKIIRCANAKAVVEMREGAIERLAIAEGEVLSRSRGTWA